MILLGTQSESVEVEDEELNLERRQRFWYVFFRRGPLSNSKLSLHGIYIPNGCKHFKILLQLFYGNKANSNKTLRTSKKGTAFQTFEINLWN